MMAQEYREAVALARRALKPMKDPNRKLTEEERHSIVRQVDGILGLDEDAWLASRKGEQNPALGIIRLSEPVQLVRRSRGEGGSPEPSLSAVASAKAEVKSPESENSPQPAVHSHQPEDEPEECREPKAETQEPAHSTPAPPKDAFYRVPARTPCHPDEEPPEDQALSALSPAPTPQPNPGSL